MRKVVLLLVFIAISFSQSSFSRAANIYQANLTGPFNCSVKAYGNFDLLNPIWDEDKDELNQAQNAINNMINYYSRSQFQPGPTYSLEYYKDSSLNLVAYILYKVNGTSIVKYYYARAINGHYNQNPFYLGSEKAVNVRPGHQMPLLNYTILDKNSNQNLLSWLIASANGGSGTSYTASNVTQLKTWRFPQGNVFLLLFSHTNGSSTYYSFVNTTTYNYALINCTYVPVYQSTIQLDYVYINRYLQVYLDSLYYIKRYYNNRNGILAVIFFQLHFDQIAPDAVFVMLTLTISWFYSPFIPVFSRTIGVILPTPQQNQFGARKLFRSGVILANELNYTKTAMNPFHTTPYFNNNDYDLRLGFQKFDQIDQSERLAITKTISIDPYYNQTVSTLFYINCFDFVFYSLVYEQPQKQIHYYLLWSKNMSLWKSIWQRTMISNQTLNPNQTLKKAMTKRDDYIHEFVLMNYTQPYYENYDFDFYTEYCPILNNRFEIGLIYTQAYVVSVYGVACMNRKNFIRDTVSNRIVYLQSTQIYKNNATLVDIQYQLCYVKPICGQITTTPITDPQQRQIFYKFIQNILVDSQGRQFLLNEIGDIGQINLEYLGLENIWTVSIMQNGLNSMYVISIDSKGKYFLLSYQQNIQGNFTNFNSNSSSSNSQNNSLPIIGASNPSITTGGSGVNVGNTSSNSNNSGSGSNTSNSGSPSTLQFTLKGNGNISASSVQAIYPSLLSLITKNGNSCSSLSSIQYYIDPFSKLVSFMVSCAAPMGFSVYQIVKLIETGTDYYVGKKSLFIVPNTYWQLNVAQPDSSFLKYINSLISTMFSSSLLEVLFLNQINFADGSIFCYYEAKLKDGTQFQGEAFFNQGTWIKLSASITVMGKPSSSPVSQNMNSSNSSQITYAKLSPNDVANDAYLKTVYQNLFPKIYQQINGLSINSVEKGAFSNGTISYRIYYGLRQNTNTKYLAIIYVPTSNAVSYFQVIDIPTASQSLTTILKVPSSQSTSAKPISVNLNSQPIQNTVSMNTRNLMQAHGESC